MSDPQHGHAVLVREDTVTLPTYPPGPADLNPMFLERRVNQGTSGRVYPNPFTDRLADAPEDRAYRAVYLENEYLGLMILPEIGGRIHEAVDKTNGFHLVYRQHVIKPALIGLFGPWISGGVEFNWPQHHRPATFMPVYHQIERHADGSATVWLSDHDPLERLKGMVGICLHPGQALMEFKVRLYNRTPRAQTFLWWVNLAVHVHDQYQVVFPPDVTIVTDHAKRSMATYPTFYGQYYGVDYQGVDLSWHKNIPVPTSYFAWASDDDFFGGYDHRAEAGIVHIANRHISPGKKMFTWGAGEYGRGWERNLTETDGPYIELMAGVYTDNQPDFSWLQPYETKTFSQYWYPVQRIGPAKNANRRAAVNLQVSNAVARIGVAVTEALPSAWVLLSAGDRILHRSCVDLVPGSPFIGDVELLHDVVETDLLLRVQDGRGDEVIRYQPRPRSEETLPDPKTPPAPPEAFDTVEELYLTGLHLEQYRYPTIDPEPYWEAALAQDPTDVRCNNAMGLSHLHRANYAQAQAHFQAAIAKLTRRNPNPRDGEPFYNLGLTLKYQARHDEAYAAFYKAVWSYAWQAAGYLALAQIDCLRRDWSAALQHLDRSLLTNAMNITARDLKATVLCLLGRSDEAAALLDETLALDPLDMWAHYERNMLAPARGTDPAREPDDLIMDRLRAEDWLVQVQTYLDLVFDYTAAGLWERALGLLSRLSEQQGAASYPMVWYALGYCAEQLGQVDDARNLYRRASQLPTDYCFPARHEELAILEHVRSLYPDDGVTAYYLGNLYYDKKRYADAIAAWECAVAQEPGFSVPWRNLGLAHYNVRHDVERAMACYERAGEANPRDGRLLSERNQLLRLARVPAEKRLALLEKHLDVVRQRDDLSVQLAELYNLTDQPEKALAFIAQRRFHPWEGGTGRVWGQYVAAHLGLAQAALDAGRLEGARTHVEMAHNYPDNLGERKHLLWPDIHLIYLDGLVKRSLGDEDGATEAWRRVLSAREGLSNTLYYQALTLRALGDEERAREKLEQLLRMAEQQLGQEPQRRFATSVAEFVFLGEPPEEQERAQYLYLVGLAQLGLGRMSEAETAFRQVLQRDPDHLDALAQLKRMKRRLV